jgi:hypothetical protein
MPRTVPITGSFAYPGGQPVLGKVVFTPQRLWVMQEGVAWASLAPVVELDRQGSFLVYVTPTDTDSVPWHYQVEAPNGVAIFSVPWVKTGYSLRELLHDSHTQSRSSDR